MFIDWLEIAQKRKWCAAEIWTNAMRHNFSDLTEEDKLKLKRQEQARKTRDMLLAKNPNHFKELAAKANAKKEQE